MMLQCKKRIRQQKTERFANPERKKTGARSCRAAEFLSSTGNDGGWVCLQHTVQEPLNLEIYNFVQSNI